MRYAQTIGKKREDVRGGDKHVERVRTAEEKSETRFGLFPFPEEKQQEGPGIALVDNFEVVLVLDERAHLWASSQNKRNHIPSQFLLVL